MRDTTEHKTTCFGGRLAGLLFAGRAIAAVLLLPCGLAWAADGDFVWAGALGGAMNDYARAIAVDDADNVYVTGEFNSTADFDPGAGTHNLTSQGSTDIYACKLDSDGALVWAVAVGGTLADVGNAIAVDGNGNVFVTGYFTGTVDFDPGAGTYSLTSSSNSIDLFILKLNSSGAFVWARGMGCPDVAGNHDDRGHAITTDASGNVYTTGRYHDTVDFDPGAGTQNLTSNGYNDIFVCKLDADGGFVWAKGMGGAGEDYGYGIAVDGDTNVYITGNFSATADFDPGAGTLNLTAQSTDGYVCRLDAAGDLDWAGQLGGTGFDGGRAIALDTDGNVYSIGNFVDTADFDPGAGTYNLTSSYAATYVSKLDSAGGFVWAKGFVGDATTGTGIAVAGNDYVYATGYLDGTSNFDAGVSDFSMTASGLDVYVAKLNTAGGFVWAKQLVGGPASPTGQSYGQAVASSVSGGIYATGYFYFEVDFDPGTGTSLINTGETLSYADAFVLSLEGLAPASGPPEVFAITALDGSPTNASSVRYSVTFSESVNGVNAGDFAVTAVGVAGASVTAVSGSADSYTVTVGTGSGNGTIRLDLVDNDSITASDDAAPLGGAGVGNGSYTAGEVYAVDKTAPGVSIGVPSVSTTANGPVTYTVTYSGASGVTLDAGDVSLNTSGNATGDVAVTGSGNASRTVVISNITGSGTLGISIAAGTAVDLAGNSAAAAGPSATFAVNGLAVAVNIGAPSLSQTNIGPVRYVVTYDNAASVTLDAADVVLNGTGNADASIGVGPVTKGEKTLYRQVTLSSITGNGTLGISIAAGTATDGSGNSAPAAGPSAIFTVDNTNPDVDSIDLSPAKALQCFYIVTFSEPVTNVDVADFALTTTGTVTGAFVTSVGGSGAVRTVGVFSGSGDGTIRLDLADNDTITDGAGNPLGGPGAGNGSFTAGEVYTLNGSAGVPLDWRWSFVVLLAIGAITIARLRRAS